MAPTPNIARITNELNHRFSGLRFEYYNRRKIGGTNRWSQHAGSEPEKQWWGNAADIFGSTALLDRAHDYLNAHRGELRIRVLLWRVRNHYDHIHVDTWPKMRDDGAYIPPPQGALVTIDSDDSVSDTFEEDDMPQFTPEEEAKLRALLEHADDLVGVGRGIDSKDSSGWGFATQGIDVIRKERRMPLHDPPTPEDEVLKRGDIVQLGNPPGT